MSERVYARLLELLPKDMVERFGTDMEAEVQVKVECARSAGRSTTGTWLRAYVDLMSTALALQAEQWRSEGRSTLAQDVRFALKALRSSPAVTLASILTLSVGIGASTATFTVVQSALLDPPPISEPDRMVYVWPGANANKAMVVLAEEMMPSLERISGTSGWTLTLTGEGEAREVMGLLVDPGYFEMLGVPPLHGRTFAADADVPGEAGVVVLSHGFWQTAFGGDPAVVGRGIELSGAEYDRRTIVGIMPPGIEEIGTSVDLWIPLEGNRALSIQEDDSWYVNDRLARLAPGATLEQANREVQAYAREVIRRVPENYSEDDVGTASVVRMTTWLTRDVRGPLWATFGAVTLVLLIGCFNVANLQLARADKRSMDHAVRVALGAGRRRMAGMLVAENLMVAGFGGLAGLGLAAALTNLLARLAPEGFPGMNGLSMEPTVLLFGIGLTLLSGLVTAVGPAIRVSRTRATSTLGRGSRGSAGASSRAAPLLVSGQIALAVVVVTGSALMLRSLDTLLSVELGMDGERVVAFRPAPSGGSYPDGQTLADYHRRVAERVAAIPGIVSTGGIHILPGTPNNWSFPTFPEGYTVPEGTPTPTSNFRATRGDYFDLTGIELVAGRFLDERDNADAERVVVVNEAFVRTFWPREEAVGRTLRIFARDGAQYRVVGVAGDVRQHGRLVEPLPEMYFPHEQLQWEQMPMYTLARFDPNRADLATTMAAIREAVTSIDPNVPIAGMTELSEALGRSSRQTQFITTLLAGFGALSLILCAVGVFGVTAYVAGRKRGEYSVRLALGSSPSAILRAALGRSLQPTALGLVVGLAAASQLSRMLGAALYEIGALDPLAFAAAPAVLGLTSLLAAALPAWRASRVDPSEALGEG